MKRKMDNRGLTLVELLVAITISMVVIGAIWQFMLVSTRTYQSQKNTTDLQLEVQQTMNQAQNLIIDADRGVVYYLESTKTQSDFTSPQDVSEKTLEVYSANKVGRLIWDKDDETVIYEESPVSNGTINDAAKERAVLAEGVQVFAADVSQVEDNQIMKIKMTFERGGKTYEATRNITLRNMICSNGTVGEIYESDVVVTTPPTITFTSYIDQLKPRYSFDFDATVQNSDETVLIWTITGQQSQDTFIDITTGILTIGDLEPKNNIISVVATLASDRNIFATYSVTILEKDPATIVVDQFPQYVLCGYEYDIHATTVPANESFSWTLADADNGTTNLSTSTIIRRGSDKDVLVVGKNQNRTAAEGTSLADIQAAAVIDLGNRNTITSGTVGAVVRIPEFDVAIADARNTDVLFDRGETLLLSPDWSESYKQKVGYGDAVYAEGDFTSDRIAWEVYYYQDGTKQTITPNSTNGGFLMPIEDVDNSKVYISGTSTNYPMVSATREITLAQPTIQLQATAKGSTFTEDNTTIPLNQKINLEAKITGIASGAIYSWKAYVDGAETDLLKNDALGVASKRYFETKQTHADKEITITVKETLSGVTDSIVMKVEEYSECTQTTPDNGEGAMYLYTMEEYVTQNPFFIPVEGMTWDRKLKVEGICYDKLGNATNISFGNVFDVSQRTGKLLFEPVARSRSVKVDYTNIQYITYHVDDATTGQHIALIKLIPQVTNYSWWESRGSGWYEQYYEMNVKIPYAAYELQSLLDALQTENKNQNSYTKEVTHSFVNYYGETFYAERDLQGFYFDLPEAESYTCQYYFYKRNSYNGINRCQISIINEYDDEVNEVIYRKDNNQWRRD